MGGSANETGFGKDADQVALEYDKKQHEECKKSVIAYEGMVENAETLKKNAEKKVEELNAKLANLEADIEQSDKIDGEQKSYISNLEKQKDALTKDYEKLKKRAETVKTTCNKKKQCTGSEVTNMLEKFASGSSFGTSILYCVLTLLIGILIGAWLFGKPKPKIKETRVEEIYVPDTLIEDV